MKNRNLISILKLLILQFPQVIFLIILSGGFRGMSVECSSLFNFKANFPSFISYEQTQPFDVLTSPSLLVVMKRKFSSSIQIQSMELLPALHLRLWFDLISLACHIFKMKVKNISSVKLRKRFMACLSLSIPVSLSSAFMLFGLRKLELETREQILAFIDYESHSHRKHSLSLPTSGFPSKWNLHYVSSAQQHRGKKQNWNLLKKHWKMFPHKRNGKARANKVMMKNCWFRFKGFLFRHYGNKHHLRYFP